MELTVENEIYAAPGTRLSSSLGTGDLKGNNFAAGAYTGHDRKSIPLSSTAPVAENASPGITPHITSTTKRKYTLWSWRWEVPSLLLCVGLLTAIFLILAAYNGQRVPDWGLSINLSTLVALLATIIRASLVVIAA